jgi:hypothetical protein
VAAFNKHNVFVGDLGLKVHDLNADTFKVLLTNTAPTAANSIRSNLTELGAGNGYSSGGTDTQNTYSAAAGTGTMVGTMVVFTASGGTIGPFRYIDIYNDTPTSPVDPLMGWWDYGAALTLNDGETFSVKFNNSATTGTIATIV